MKLRRGWSGEMSSGSWVKLDLEFEQEDIEKLLEDNSLKYLDVSIIDLFILVGAEVETLLMADAMSHGANVKDKVLQANKLKSDTISKIKSKLSLIENV